MKNKLFFLFGLLIPAFVVYKSVLVFSLLAFGDAPYFYPEALSLFLHKPLAWWNIGNGLGGVNLLIWISPLMYIYSLLGTKLTFYFPTILLSFVTPIIFVKYFKFSNTVKFFSAIVYGLNTYIILLIDGGQVGVSLAYSIFPIILLFLYKFAEKVNYKNFLKATISLFVLTLIDPRVTIIAFLTILFWKPKKVINLLLLGLVLEPLNMFWLLPLFKNGGGSLSLEVSSLGLTSFLNSLLLYQPHWPNNIYGQITYPPFYFILIPILIFSAFLFKKDKYNKILKVFGLLFLVFAFFVKGETAPLGFIYQFMVNKIPFGSVLRDSSKFFIPLMLFGGILIGYTVDRLKYRFIKIISYLALLFLLTPALLGRLNFILSNKVYSTDYQIIYQNLKNDPSNFKTLWFPEKPTLGFVSQSKPAINAKSLVDLRPVASLNVGSSDSFNFFSHTQSSNWVRLLGIKYLFFPGDSRKFEFSESEISDWQRLLKNVSENVSFKKLNWDTDMLVYEVIDPKEKSFVVNKMLAVVGGEDIYEKENINPLTTGTIFLEDGKVDVNDLLKLDIGSLNLIYNDKDKTDLKFSFLKDNFLNQGTIYESDWGKYSQNDYLLWKYQLLIRGIDIKEQDYQKGILLSTKSDEEVIYNINIKNQGKYIVGVRGMGDENNKLLLQINSLEEELTQKKESFGWQYVEVNFEKGKQKLILTNKSGLQIVNTVAVIPIDEWNLSEQKTKEFEKKFVNKNETSVSNWLIYSENYNSQLQLDCGDLKLTPVPIYSMINGYLINNCLDSNKPYFVGQKYVDLGIKVSALTFVIISLLAIYLKRNPQKYE